MPKLPLITLILILCAAFFIRIYNLNYNSPFFDEAQYIVLGKKVLLWQWQESTPFSWVGGYPLFYPPLAATFASFGITGARFLSVILGTMAVFLSYSFSKNLHLGKTNLTNIWVGLLAAAFLSLMAIPIYLSRLAIYDMLSFTLLLLSLSLITQAINKDLNQKNYRWLMILASVMFYFSFLAKYTTVIFLPFITLWAFLTSHLDKKRVVRLLISNFWFPAGVLIGLYLLSNYESLKAFYLNQIGEEGNSFIEIIRQYFEYNLLVLFLASFGSVVLVLKKDQLKPLVLLFLSSIILFIHLFTNNLRTFHQHTFLITIFLLPLGAYFLVWLFNKSKLTGIFTVTLVLAATFYYNQIHLKELETSWTNTNEVHTFLSQNVAPGQRILSFEDDITILALPNHNPEDINGIYSLEYQELSDDETYSQALKDGYFDFVLVNEDVEGPIADIIKQEVKNNYQPIYNNHPFLIYKKNS